MPNIGPMEIAIVLIIALIVFGPKKLPELGTSLGKGLREFKASISGDSDDSNHKSEDAKQARLEAVSASEEQKPTRTESRPVEA